MLPPTLVVLARIDRAAKIKDPVDHGIGHGHRSVIEEAMGEIVNQHAIDNSRRAGVQTQAIIVAARNRGGQGGDAVATEPDAAATVVDRGRFRDVRRSASRSMPMGVPDATLRRMLPRR